MPIPKEGSAGIPMGYNDWHFQIFWVTKFQIPHPLPFQILFKSLILVLKLLYDSNDSSSNYHAMSISDLHFAIFSYFHN